MTTLPTDIEDAATSTLAVAGGFFAGGVLVALSRGESSLRMFSGDRRELAAQATAAVLSGAVAVSAVR